MVLPCLHSPSEPLLRSSLFLGALPAPVWVQGSPRDGMDRKPMESRPRCDPCLALQCIKETLRVALV